MVSILISITVGVAVLAALYACAAAGFRNGDQPDDAWVTARLRDAGQPDEPRPVVAATVRNPSPVPVLAGLSVRRAIVPGWLAGGHNVTVPRRTARRRLRPGRYATVGIVPPYGHARFTVPVPASARRYLLTAAIGQAGGRLRLHRVPVGGVALAARARLSVPSGEGRSDLAGTIPGASLPGA